MSLSSHVITFKKLWLYVTNEYRRTVRDIESAYGENLYSILSREYLSNNLAVKYVYIDDVVKYRPDQYIKMLNDKQIFFLPLTLKMDFKLLTQMNKYPFLEDYIQNKIEYELDSQLQSSLSFFKGFLSEAIDSKDESKVYEAVDNLYIKNEDVVNDDNIDELNEYINFDNLDVDYEFDYNNDSINGKFQVSEKEHFESEGRNYKRINTPMQFFFKTTINYIRRLKIISNLDLDFGKKNVIISKVENVMSLE